MKRRILVALGWTWAGAIVWLSLTPSPPTIDIQSGDKLGHFMAYGALMSWFSFLYSKAGTRLAYAAGFVAMGIGLEFVQGWLGYRTFEVFDMLANSIGVLLGLALALAMPRITAR